MLSSTRPVDELDGTDPKKSTLTCGFLPNQKTCRAPLPGGRPSFIVPHPAAALRRCCTVQHACFTFGDTSSEWVFGSYPAGNRATLWATHPNDSSFRGRGLHLRAAT